MARAQRWRSAPWPPAPWPRWAPLAVIALVALLVRLLLVLEPRVVWGDEPFYLWLGRNWITGQGFQFVGHPDVHHGPLFPMLAGLLYWFTHDLELASDILFVVLGGLLVLPVYGLGAEVYDRRVGLAAATLAAVWPGLSVAVLNWGSLTEPAYLLFVATGLYLGLVALRGRWDCFRRPVESLEPGARWWVYALAGLSIGLAYLTRPEAVIYVAIIGLAILVVNLIQGRWRTIALWRDLSLLALGFGLAFVPYAIYLRVQTGAWMVSEKVGVAYLTGIGLAHGDTAAFDRSTWGLDSTGLETFFFSSESYTISMLHLVLGDLGLFVRIVYLNAMRFVRVLIDWSLLPAIVLPLVILGLFDRGWSRERTIKELYLLLTWVPVLSFLLFFIQARYLVAAMPVAILWVARGALKLGDWLVGTATELRTPPAASGTERPLRYLGSRGRATLEWLPVVLAGFLLLGAQDRVRQEVNSVGSVSPTHRVVGEMLADQTPADAVVMCRYPAIAFHADRRWTPTPNASWDQVLNYARHKGVDYFVIDQRELRYRPQFQPLVSGEDVPPQLELLFEARVEGGREGGGLDDGERLIVYHLVDR
jgi:4-amino-4-deoxy-L-arabinose transferase-like glycosyltransferase